ncbi:MAG: thioredoxin domain-containing protein [bacterium]|nr:thioredoxin domain-containing protein [bacterium]
MSALHQESTKKTGPWYLRWYFLLLAILIGLLAITLFGLLIQRLLFGGQSVDDLVTVTQNSWTESDLLGSERQPQVESSEIPELGTDDAEVVIVVFTNFDCAECRIASPILRQIVSEYGGAVALQFRSYLPVTNEESEKRLEAAYCADLQEKFWLMHDRLYLNANVSSADDLADLAAGAGIHRDNFFRCLADETFAETITRDTSLAATVGVNEAPVYFVNGYMIEGVLDKNDWYGLLELFLPGYDPRVIDELDQTPAGY